MKFLMYVFCLLSLTSCTFKDPHQEIILNSIVDHTFGVDRQPNGIKFWREPDTDPKNQEKYPEASIGWLKISGLRPGEKFTLYKVNSVYEVTKLADVIANVNGELVLKDGTLANFFLTESEFAPGEIIYYTLCERGGDYCLVTSFFPIPLIYTWSDGAAVKLVRQHIAECDFLLTGFGFHPRETLRQDLDNQITQCQASPRGLLARPIIVNGSKKGKHSLSISRESGEQGCIEFTFGEELLK